MTSQPAEPKIFHITHVSNLGAMVAADELRSDRRMLQRGGPTSAVGMSKIKRRRLSLPVSCHPGTMVGDFVPFYFCPRSIMLYMLHRGNHPELDYKGGQDPIVHLQADLTTVLRWAAQQRRCWAFTTTNASARYARFYSDAGQLGDIDWAAVSATDFRDAGVGQRKQAEFLVQDTFPWALVERIGVRTAATRGQALTAIERATHQPQVNVEPSWYF